MKNIHQLFCALGMAALLGFPTVSAQTSTDAVEHPMIITPHTQTFSYAERTLCYNIQANIPFETSIDADWATVRRGTGNTVFIHLAPNYTPTKRTATLTCSNQEKGISRSIIITQGPDASAETIPQDETIIPSSYQDNNHASSGNDGGIANSLDGNYNTLYHSSYSANVNENNPAILTYNFKNVEKINYINYVPRQGGGNGCFGRVNVYVKQEGDADYRLFKEYDWKFSSSISTIDFGENGLTNPVSVRFEVLTGQGNFASCAEMEFRKRANASDEMGIFADDIYSTLREGVTEDDIDRLRNPFVKGLASKLFAGNYRKDYRVASFECLMETGALADSWNCPGKRYDQCPGVTGISYGPGTYAIAVSGIPVGKTVTLKLISWYNGIVGGNFNGGNPQEVDYSLQNGLNTIVFTPQTSFDYLNKNSGGEFLPSYNALAYIDYNDMVDPESYPDIKVHFINGDINGYLSPDKTNEEMHELTANAVNSHMDVVGKKVHSVWSSAGLHKYCKSIDGGIGYRQYMNVIDSLIQWEHDLLGFTKYNHQPKNRTFAYVNYTYYMFQGGRGVSFHQDQESRVLNCDKLVNRDDDAIWGLSHEWGHQHQMHPYFCWKGVNEVTNNMNSYYNIMRMGYRTSDKINQWAPARRHFIEDNPSGANAASSVRKEAFNRKSQLSWNPDYLALATEMEGGEITSVADNKLRARGINDVSVGETLCPFIMLYAYFSSEKINNKVNPDYKADFGPDFYEALRQTDRVDGGSVIEKKSGFDKYELVAAAQNNNKNGLISKLNDLFPNSIWCRYITEDHCGQWDNNMPYILNLIRKASRLTGYNLFPYFEAWGFLRNAAAYIGDYGDGWQILTMTAYNEFKADMDALVESGELKEMPEGMVEAISNTPNMFQSKPTFPN